MNSERILDFLRARLDDDERQAENLDELGGFERNGIESTAGGQVLDYLDHFSPARMRRAVAVKRRVLDFAADAQRVVDGWPEGVVSTERSGTYWHAVRLLAEEYDEHPDYDEAWRP